MANCAHCQAKIGLINYKKVGPLYFCNSRHHDDYRKERQQESRVIEFLRWLRPHPPFS